MQFGDFEALFRDIITCSMYEDEETDFLFSCVFLDLVNSYVYWWNVQKMRSLSCMFYHI